jgi:hypothetical protein
MLKSITFIINKKVEIITLYTLNTESVEYRKPDIQRKVKDWCSNTMHI